MVSKITGVKLRAGQRLRLETPGGGGWGDAASREPAKVAGDVARGFVSAQSAREAYRVALGPDGAVDAEGTLRLRAEASR